MLKRGNANMMVMPMRMPLLLLLLLLLRLRLLLLTMLVMLQRLVMVDLVSTMSSLYLKLHAQWVSSSLLPYAAQAGAGDPGRPGLGAAAARARVL